MQGIETLAGSIAADAVESLDDETKQRLRILATSEPDTYQKILTEGIPLAVSYAIESCIDEIVHKRGSTDEDVDAPIVPRPL